LIFLFVVGVFLRDIFQTTRVKSQTSVGHWSHYFPPCICSNIYKNTWKLLHIIHERWSIQTV